jgi:DNA-binding response OmpR family regulator
VLFLTADSDEYTTMQAADAGGEHFVTKPIRPAVILGLVREILQSENKVS